MWLNFLWVFRQITENVYTFRYIAQMALWDIWILGRCQSLSGTSLNLWPLAIIVVFLFWIAVISFFFLKQFLIVSSLCNTCVLRILPFNFCSFCSRYSNLYLTQKTLNVRCAIIVFFDLKIICTSWDEIEILTAL